MVQEVHLGNLLPQWKHTFGSVEKISSGDFVSLWTGRIDHLAKRFSVVDGGASQVHPPKAKLAVPRPLPVLIFERLGLMRASFMVLSLSQGHLPLMRSLRVLKSRWCETALCPVPHLSLRLRP